MKKIKNNSGKLLLLGVDGVNVDLQPGQEVAVLDNFMERFKSCLSLIEEVPMPEKKTMDPFGKIAVEGPKEEPKEEKPKEELKEKKVLTQGNLEAWSFTKLKQFGSTFKPPVTDRSKAKLIKELLVRLNET